jgi:hypothetical protein
MLRIRLRALVVAWLLCQLAAFAAAPVLSASGLGLHPGEVPCDCPDAQPGAACPMHRSPARPSDDSTCVVTSACAPQDAALLSLNVGLGVPASPVGIESPSIGEPTRLRPVASRSFVRLPDAPPPRA